MLSSIKPEKNLPGDRRVRWEVLASPNSLFLSPSVAIYFSWQKNNFGTKDVKHFFFFFVPQQMRYMGIKKETEKQITICKLSFPRVFFTVTTFSLHCVRWPVLLRLKLYHF